MAAEEIRSELQTILTSARFGGFGRWWLRRAALMNRIVRALEVAAYGCFAATVFVWSRLDRPGNWKDFAVAAVLVALLARLSVAIRKGATN